MPPKRKPAGNRHAKRQKRGDSGRYPIKPEKNGSFTCNVSLKTDTDPSGEYHVGDMVLANVKDTEPRKEPAVIAAFPETEAGIVEGVLLVWLFKTKNSEARKKAVGVEVASNHNDIMTIYTDVFPMSALEGRLSISAWEQVCIDWVLDLDKPQPICITEPRDRCFMRHLVEKIKAQKPREGSAVPTGSLDGNLSQQGASSPSQKKNGEPNGWPEVNTSPSHDEQEFGSLFNFVDEGNSEARSNTALERSTGDRDTGSENQQHPQPCSSNILKQKYDKAAKSALSRLKEFQQMGEKQQLPQHLKDGKKFLGSFSDHVPVFEPEYLSVSSTPDDFSRSLLVTTLPAFQHALLRKNQEMPKYVLIKDLERSPAMETHWKNYMRKYLHEHRETQLEIQDVTDKGELTFYRSASEVCSRLLDNTAPCEPTLRQDRKPRNTIPWNLLNINGRHIHTEGLPAIQGIWQYRYLTTLCEQIEQPDLLSAGKHQGPKQGNFGLSGHLNFALLGERGSYSKAHVDLLGSTGIEILFGSKAWFLLDGDMTDDEKSQFAKLGQEWQPSPERTKMVPLEPGDTLLMMPGHLSPHLVFTLETSLSRGGMFWDELKVPCIVNVLHWILEHPETTNEHVNPDITKLVDDLEKGGQAPEEVSSLKEYMLPKFKCECKDTCGPACQCMEDGNILRSRGCTNWCSCACEVWG